MELKAEWEHRIQNWMRVLAKDLYRPLGDMTFEARPTMSRLDLQTAMQGEFQPIKAGDAWGQEWEYLWLRSRITLPEEAAGERIVMNLDLGGEASLYVDGKPFGTRRADWIIEKHHFVCDETLTTNGVPGQSFDLVFEAYAGHDFPGCEVGPVLPGSLKRADPQKKRTHLGDCTFGVWNETAYQLLIDVKALWELMRHIPDTSLRYQKLWEGLKAFSCMVDFEQPADKRQNSYRAAREALAPLLACRNGSTMPRFYAFGHAHIDIAWLWPFAETERKVLRTFAAQIRHMEEYPEYKFLQSQPHLYQMVKELYPSLYEKIKEKVAAGQWIPEGGMWVEADTNITSGESLIRQFVHGKRFFREEFGVDSHFLWLPDVFGYTAALPQIMKGCGIDSFSTQKIWWCYNGGQRFPYNFFYWEGMDGTRISSFMHNNYNSNTNPGDLVERWNRRAQKTGYDAFLLPFGYGDGGGGPARDFIEYIRREGDLEGCPKTKMSTPAEFFAENETPDEVYVGELYLQCHRGVQTSQARTKKGNRKSELALREAEMWGALAGTMAQAEDAYAFPLDRMDAAWKNVLLCQFHDVLPGSSIGRVYRDAEAIYDKVLAEAADVCDSAMDVICGQSPAGDSITVFNSLSWERQALVKLPASFQGARMGGCILPVQQAEEGLFTLVTVPSCGFVTLENAESVQEPQGVSALLTANGATMENEWLSVCFNQRGEMTSCVDKQTGSEWIKGPGNEMRMYQNIPRQFEAWDMDLTYESNPVELPEDAELAILSAGPLCATLKVARRLNHSVLCQKIHLRKNSRRVDFETTVEWQESHKLLKVCFPVSVYSEEAIQEIQFGHVKRPTHRSQPFDVDRFEVCNHKWTALAESGRGAAVLNDCKYGVNVLGNSINLTLLHSSCAPDPDADRGTQIFTYSFMVWNDSFLDSDVVREAYDLNCPVLTHAGAAGSASLLRVDAPNVIVETVKPAEDGSGDVIIRLYEAKKTATAVRLSVSIPGMVLETDMLEENGVPLQTEKAESDTIVPLQFRPFEIKTLRFIAHEPV